MTRPKTSPYRYLVSFLALAALTAGAVAQDRKPDKADPARQEALERFRKLSEEERLRLAEKAAGARAFITVKRGDLDLTIVERGAVDDAKASEIVCRVKPRATIKWIIEDGTYVNKGDRLIELDGSGFREQLATQKIHLEKAVADKVAAEEGLKLIGKQNQRDIRAAEINLRLARLALKRFTGKDADEKEVLALKVELGQLDVEVARQRARVKTVQAEAEVKSKRTIAEQEEAKKKDVEQELAACVITSPTAGLAVYHVSAWGRFGRAAIVAKGEPVREGQKLMRICELTHFHVNTRVHEARISRVRVGQKATVRVDAFPGRAFRGEVKSVATVASAADWLSADVKVYAVVVDLGEPMIRLRPGMSTEVRIEVQGLTKVLRVPVEAVVRSGRETYCYVKAGKGLQLRRVKVGAQNDRDVEIQDGLKEDEVVLRSPGAVAGQVARPGQGP